MIYCSIPIIFAPVAPDIHSSTITVTGDAPDSPQAVVNGTGAQPSISVRPLAEARRLRWWQLAGNTCPATRTTATAASSHTQFTSRRSNVHWFTIRSHLGHYGGRHNLLHAGRHSADRCIVGVLWPNFSELGDYGAGDSHR